MTTDEQSSTPSTPWLPGRRVTESIALLAGVAPILVAILRNLGTKVPLGDAGYFVTRSRDVATQHHPFIGAWTSGTPGTSADTANNLGPLHLDLLAPFTKLDPYWGTVVGTGLLSVVSVIGVWLVARRMFGPVGVAGAMLATLALESSIGTEMMVDARQQATLLLPFWCLLWLAVACSAGVVWALPALAFVSSLVVQTHLSYVLPTMVVLAAVGTMVVTNVRGGGHSWKELVRPAAVSAAVSFVCWAQPLWDHSFGTGNFGRVRKASGEPAIGIRRGAGIVTESFALPPFGFGGHIEDFLNGSSGEPTTTTLTRTAAVAAWIVGSLVAAALARRSGDRVLAAITAVGFAGIIGGLAGAMGLPADPFSGLRGPNYFWLWPIGVFAMTAIVATFLRLTGWLRLAGPAVHRRPQAVLIAVALPVLAGLALLRTTDYWIAGTADEAAARNVLDEIAPALDRADIDGPVVVEFVSGVGEGQLAFIMLSELQRAGIDFHFGANSLNLRRFGRNRCADGSEQWVVSLMAGTATPDSLPPGGRLVLSDDAVPASDVALLAELDALVADAIRAGEIRLDEGGMDFFGLEVSAEYRDVLADPDQPATGLIADLRAQFDLGLLDIDEGVRDLWDRWIDLDKRNDRHRFAMIAAPTGGLESRPCP